MDFPFGDTVYLCSFIFYELPLSPHYPFAFFNKGNLCQPKTREQPSCFQAPNAAKEGLNIVFPILSCP